MLAISYKSCNKYAQLWKTAMQIGINVLMRYVYLFVLNYRFLQLKRVRSLLANDAQNYDEFYTEFRLMYLPFESCAKDLRSQTCREACITIAYVCLKLIHQIIVFYRYITEKLKMKSEAFCDAIFTALINLMSTSAKVMSTSGFVACTFIVKVLILLLIHSSRICI
jgi:hypothetical protein